MDPIGEHRPPVQMGGLGPSVEHHWPKTVTLLYLLLRQAVSPAEMEDAAIGAEGAEPGVSLTNPYLAEYARNIAGRVRDEAVDSTREGDLLKALAVGAANVEMLANNLDNMGDPDWGIPTAVQLARKISGEMRAVIERVGGETVESLADTQTDLHVEESGWLPRP